MNRYGSLRAWVIYSQSDSVISKGSPQRLWKIEHYEGILLVKNTVWLYQKIRGLNVILSIPIFWEKGCPSFITLMNILCRKKTLFLILFLILCSVSWIEVLTSFRIMLIFCGTGTPPICEDCSCSAQHNPLSLELMEQLLKQKAMWQSEISVPVQHPSSFCSS